MDAAAAAVVEVVVGGVRWGGRGVVAAAARWRRRRTAGTPGVIAPSVRHAGQTSRGKQQVWDERGKVL